MASNPSRYSIWKMPKSATAFSLKPLNTLHWDRESKTFQTIVSNISTNLKQYSNRLYLGILLHSRFKCKLIKYFCQMMSFGVFKFYTRLNKYRI
jgi:hypothetical protein